MDAIYSVFKDGVSISGRPNWILCFFTNEYNACIFAKVTYPMLIDHFRIVIEETRSVIARIDQPQVWIPCVHKAKILVGDLIERPKREMVLLGLLSGKLNPME